MEGNAPSGSIQSNPSPPTSHPSSLAQEVGWYVYCILPSSAGVSSLAGIDEQFPLALIVEGAIGALVSLVPLAEWSGVRLKQHLEDLGWVEEKTRRHEAIIEAAMKQSPVLPFRFCTLFESPERVQEVLREHRATLQESLEYLRDKEEWGVKGFSDRLRLRQLLMELDPTLLRLSKELDGQPPGLAFFLRKQLESLVSLKAEEREVELAQSVEEALQRKVVDLVKSSPLSRKVTGRGQEMIVNLACLVPKEEVKGFLAMVARWNSAYEQEGFELVVSGPWPPYHFVPLLKGDAH